MDAQIQQIIETLQAQVADLTRRMNERDHQQLRAPFDDVSKAVIGAAIGAGPGSHALTQSIAIGAVPTNITVPVGFVGSRIIDIDGSGFEFPYISKV